jgi:hypothetical protein
MSTNEVGVALPPEATANEVTVPLLDGTGLLLYACTVTVPAPTADVDTVTEGAFAVPVTETGLVDTLDVGVVPVAVTGFPSSTATLETPVTDTAALKGLTPAALTA